MSDTLASRMSALPMDTIHFGARTLKRVMFIPYAIVCLMALAMTYLFVSAGMDIYAAHTTMTWIGWSLTGVGLLLAAGIYYLIVSQVLGYRESREFLAWLGDKEAFMSDMRRYRQLISDTKSLSVEQKDKIAGSLSKGRDDLKAAAGKKTKMFTTVLSTAVGILAGIMPIIESLSDEAEDIKERADAAMGIMGNIRPPLFSMAFGTFAIVELSAMVALL